MLIRPASARAAAALLTLALLVAPLVPASADTRDDEAAAQSAPKKKPAASVPKALPGSHVETFEPAPLDRPPSEMKPNEALFDGVNRGDIASVREALARGAELETPNMLGQTATELSIDLGRNEITFLLLSMRGAAGRPLPRNVTGPSTAAATARPAPVARPVAVVVPKPVIAAKPTTPAAQVAARPVVANNPGTPAPQAGFLGFGRSPQ